MVRRTRPQVRNCAPGNLEIPGSMLSHRPGMTAILFFFGSGDPSLMSTIDLDASPGDLRALAEQSNAWPFEQAKAIVARLKKNPKDEVLFETGYGPSGLPHIGTFGEADGTTMVRHAFRVVPEDKIKTRLLAFSDDMDGLRKVPDNVPNKEMLPSHLGKPLSRIPDPVSNEYPSF